MQTCDVCQESQNTQAEETLQPHEVPTRPWQVVGNDSLDHGMGMNIYSWVTITSRFQLSRKYHMDSESTGNTVVNLTKCVFSEQGVPEVTISGNGSHYNCNSYKEFSKEWGFQHVTLSPRYPHSNGKQQVQTAKHILDKAKKSGQDPHMSLLCL